ncbi:Dam family site-specific DNA-(adenine-N6)-methyltransferase [Mucilaginibacter sp.]|jgi:DNA adenine methylase|uniref:DNA adenine methylase n=1 Tax=Mucilaginibacter sp. TaxID=1882438 RepID=UPI002C31F837|nr:Dam family site-specific DNA-(adenine-N6)-methyltransferase [Mucilaginibacter sp.]HTI61204.1 Dam family site-specific DNA-(adenine-N6)-methyltransferase [Mucilaginibacter sp.]
MEPFLKWAGGKRWLVNRDTGLLPQNNGFNRYIEPFLGSGAVFFHVQPRNGILSDLNSDLINSYTIIRDCWEDLLEILIKYDKRHSKEFYYKIRASRPKSQINKAARFIYLNRTCWNGLYRVNKKGEFNVPIGTKTKVLLSEDNFAEVSHILQNVEIEVCDFERSIDKANEGDFVFVDPPYTVKHNLNGFVKYNETIFTWGDQERLKNAILRAQKRGAEILLLNANHQSIKTLYNGIGNTTTLDRASVIAGNPLSRGTYSELAIKC